MKQNENQSSDHWKLSRRHFLAAAAAAGVTAAFGDGLLTYAPWQDYEAQARRTWETPFQAAATGTARMREMIRYATLAPSGHNTQPWKFAIFGSAIRIFPDHSRRLAVIDPLDRELWIALGCALENLDIAAQHDGYMTEISYPEPEADYLTLHLKPSSTLRPIPLFEAIPHRQSTRSLYDGQAVSLADLGKIETVTPATNITMQLLTGPKQKETILEYLKSANQSQYGDQAFIDELVRWLRFNKPEALHHLDGLYTRCSGNPEVPRWLGKRFITTASGGQRSAIDETNFRSSSGFVVIAAAQDDKRHWIDTGRFYERLALTLTTLNIKMAFLNQPLEVSPVRSQFQNYLHLGPAQPQLLLRFGYADAMPRSLRRPVEEVLL